MNAKSQPRTPKFRLHKATQQGYVELDRRRIYLGRWGKPETEQAYHRTVAEWLANGRRLPVEPHEATIVELCSAYWHFAKIHYRKPDGTESSELHNVQRAIRILKDLYGSTRVADFGPLQLKTVRHQFIEEGISRGVVNHYTGTIRRIFKWGVSEAVVPVAVHAALQTIRGLQRGRSEARETESIKPIPMDHVEAVKPRVSRQVEALIDLQLLTGARPGELLKLRAIDFDTSGAVWTVTLSDHKTSYRGRERVLYFGPKAQAIVKRFMADRALDAYLLSPRDAETKRYADAETHRRPDQKPNPRKTNRTIGDTYTPDSYRRAIERGCVEADVPKWTPHRLRHNAATFIRKEYGLEAAQILLGHSHADTTQIYAEADHEKAIKVVSEVG